MIKTPVNNDIQPDAALSAEIVIPSYRRLDILRHTLIQLRRLYPETPVCLGIQDILQHGDIETLIDHDRNTRVELLSSPGTTLALNHCLRTSRADIVLIMDDDAVPCHGWLESHLSAFIHDPELAYTSGREVRSTHGRSALSEFIRIFVESVAGLLLNKEKKLNGRIIGCTTWSGLIFGNFDQPGSCRINAPRGCNMAVRREAFMTIGGFNAIFRGNAWGFEAEFGLRMEKAGNQGRYIGDAIVIHHEVPTGGSREASSGQWFSDFLFNHSLLIKQLGTQAWLGSLPRLIKKRLVN